MPLSSLRDIHLVPTYKFRIHLAILLLRHVALEDSSLAVIRVWLQDPWFVFGQMLKVLGVTRDADEREIKKAYRKLSKVYHPDKASANNMTPEDAQKKMAAVNEAYEVLSDPELKERFDRGDDPNNNEQQQGHPFQGSPFGGQQFMFRQGGGFPGGGGSFKFQQGGGFPGGFPGGFGF